LRRRKRRKPSKTKLDEEELAAGRRWGKGERWGSKKWSRGESQVYRSESG